MPMSDASALFDETVPKTIEKYHTFRRYICSFYESYTLLRYKLLMLEFNSMLEFRNTLTL